MLSKAKVRFIKQLQVKKYRLAEQSFVVQGNKVVKETLESDFGVKILLATESFLNALSPKLSARAGEVIIVNEQELAAVGSVETNNAALAVVSMATPKPLSLGGWMIALDDIRDPGNLGTIIRTADWYGVSQIVASPETTDFYNPKVISATMGSFLRVRMHYTPMTEFLKKSAAPVYGALLKGENVHTKKFDKQGILVIGNESRGISGDVEKLITHRITIPKLGEAESLNASVATAVILDNIFRYS